ncbi:hypothetical protein OSSY52_10880 [Tepiditoga spiralis]|uniref:HTH luxR-type domain-containing protein n=1 Tax=Tepiditoga spiralis TaxID=2108365 RepID=A0A7G1G7N2_9BACT|nr:hypothetical protein [Tepiditoga spiralis]BBE30947.1 hypothetical protein OSSY52_10880 [Tepiditoga spiralis]
MVKNKELINEKKSFKIIELYVMGFSNQHISRKLNVSLDLVKKITQKIK